MNCYLCLVETECRDRPAYAACQRCGGGMCNLHLKELQFYPAAGMAYGSHPTPRYSLICERCYLAAASAVKPIYMRKLAMPSLKNWRQLFRQRSSPTLPIEEDDAVTIAEQFLKQQRMR